jgi:hypothetical protein
MSRSQAAPLSDQAVGRGVQEVNQEAIPYLEALAFWLMAVTAEMKKMKKTIGHV